MPLTPFQTLMTILAVALATVLTRFLPFWLFPQRREPPAVVSWLGKLLPAAMMGLLVVYCLKDAQFSGTWQGYIQLAGVAIVAVLHLWKRNVLLSIGGGTLCYVLLLQLVS